MKFDSVFIFISCCVLLRGVHLFALLCFVGYQRAATLQNSGTGPYGASARFFGVSLSEHVHMMWCNVQLMYFCDLEVKQALWNVGWEGYLLFFFFLVPLCYF